MHRASGCLIYSSSELLGGSLGSLLDLGLGMSALLPPGFQCVQPGACGSTGDLEQAAFWAGLLTNTRVPGRFHSWQCGAGLQICPRCSLSPSWLLFQRCCCCSLVPSCVGSSESLGHQWPQLKVSPGSAGGRGQHLWGEPRGTRQGCGQNPPVKLQELLQAVPEGGRGKNIFWDSHYSLLLLRLSVAFMSGPLVFQPGCCPIFLSVPYLTVNSSSPRAMHCPRL